MTHSIAAPRRRAQRARWAAAGVLVLLVAAILGPAIAPRSVTAMELERRLEAPSLAHPLGLDELGRDVLSRLLAGARVSVTVGLVVVGIAGTLGTLLGVAAGAAGGRWDTALMRAIDVFLAFPGILLAIALVAVLGPALSHVVLALAAIGWVGYARLARGQVLQLREQEYVLAARASGVGTARLVLRHLLPNVLPLTVVQASLGLAGAILAEASLSFLGLGIQPPTPSWGAMINAGRGHLLDAPHVTLFPGLAILFSVMSLNFLGDALVDRLDPRRAKDFESRPQSR
ncbi:MAG: peptide ABC transporter permease [Acidobacteriota bacterium]